MRVPDKLQVTVDVTVGCEGAEESPTHNTTAEVKEAVFELSICPEQSVCPITTIEVMPELFVCLNYLSVLS